jgi:hypothetical protein
MPAAAPLPFGPQGPFFLTEDRVEALSRLLFVAEERRPFAVLTGPTGVGKSRLLDEFSRQLRRAGRSVFRVDASGLVRDELTRELLAACHSTEDRSTSWQALEDALIGRGLTGDGGVWLLDHLDRTADDLRPAVQRFLQLLGRSEVRGTLIVTTTDIARLRELRDRADWPITLGRWTPDDTASVVERGLNRQPLPRFTPEALAWIIAESMGHPTTTLRWCELAVLASEVHGAAVIDVDLVREAYRPITSAAIESDPWRDRVEHAVAPVGRD